MNVLFTILEREVCFLSKYYFRFNISFSGSTYIWTFNLRSKDKPSKWVLAGVALLLQI